MSTYKVCILAAGKGLRMGELTHNVNKSLLPINQKAIISHIIDKFDSSVEIVVALGYEGKKVEEYLEHAHPNRKIKAVHVECFEGPGSGPGLSLLSCEKYLQDPFIIFAGDTLVKEPVPAPDKDWLGVATVPLEEKIERFCSAQIKNGKIIKLTDKKKCDNTYVFIGVAGVCDYKGFWNALKNNDDLVNGELQLSNGLEFLLKKGLYPEKFTWLDTGTKQTYLSSRSFLEGARDKFNFDKINEFTYLFDGRLIKYFSDPKKVELRYNRSLALAGLCPKVSLKTTWFFSYSLLKGSTLYECLTPQVTLDFLQWCKKYLWKPVNSPEGKDTFLIACKNFYQNKTYKRVQSFQKKYADLDDKEDIINGSLTPTLSELLSQIPWNYLIDGVACNFHGDLQFDNVLKTGWNSSEKDDFKLIDWRQDFGGLINCGDLYYDLAKLYGGLTMPYNLIKDNKFSYDLLPSGEINFDIQSSYRLMESRSIFEKFIVDEGFDLQKIELIRALIFLNMAPLHESPFDKLLYYAARYHLHKSLTRHHGS